mmetsp:Transcript_11432/g.38644  ORF Transcript_11432/g.38644 Transcript_11432/m.38644 type:complete len:241 (+) Transcript_11432:311-1033(+)
MGKSAALLGSRARPEEKLTKAERSSAVMSSRAFQKCPTCSSEGLTPTYSVARLSSATSTSGSPHSSASSSTGVNMWKSSVGTVALSPACSACRASALWVSCICSASSTRSRSRSGVAHRRSASSSASASASAPARRRSGAWRPRACCSRSTTSAPATSADSMLRNERTMCRSTACKSPTSSGTPARGFQTSSGRESATSWRWRHATPRSRPRWRNSVRASRAPPRRDAASSAPAPPRPRR